MKAELVAERRRREIALVVANDADRATFTVIATGGMCVVDGRNLSPLHEWQFLSTPPALSDGWGCHSARADEGIAFLSTPSEVRLLDSDGGVRWAFGHESWVGFGRGCTWFDADGTPFAVLPADPKCRIVQFDIGTGKPVAEATVEPDSPAGMIPLHHRTGWIGISESEAENAARAWFVHAEAASGSRLVVIDAGWDDKELSDINAMESTVLTTGLDSGRLTVHSFPGLQVLRTIEIQNDEFHLGACFVSSRIVTRLYRRQTTIVIDSSDRIEQLDVDDGWLVPGPQDSWLSVTRNALRRWAISD